jgi:hypothetical protein
MVGGEPVVVSVVLPKGYREVGKENTHLGVILYYLYVFSSYAFNTRLLNVYCRHVQTM